MLSRTGTNTRPGYNRLTYLPSSFIPLFFPPSPPLPDSGLITDVQDGSCLLRISIANEAEQKEVRLECAETEAALSVPVSERAASPAGPETHTPGEEGEACSKVHLSSGLQEKRNQKKSYFYLRLGGFKSVG